MGTENIIEIPIDKRKVVLWLLAILMLGCVGVWLVQNGGTFSIQIVNHYATPFGIAFTICVPFLGPFYVIKMFAKSPGFIISDKGITDNSSMTSHGYISWDEITGIGEKQVGVRNCITLTLKNPQTHIDSSSSGYKRFAWSSNYKRFGVSAILTSSVLKCSYDELLTMLKTGLEKYKASNQ